MICINGEMKEGYDEKSLAYMIEQEGFNISRIATEINGEIISCLLYTSPSPRDS